MFFCFFLDRILVSSPPPLPHSGAGLNAAFRRLDEHTTPPPKKNNRTGGGGAGAGAGREKDRGLQDADGDEVELLENERGLPVDREHAGGAEVKDSPEDVNIFPKYVLILIGHTLYHQIATTNPNLSTFLTQRFFLGTEKGLPHGARGVTGR